MHDRTDNSDRPTPEPSYTDAQSRLVEGGLILYRLAERTGDPLLRTAYGVLQGVIDVLDAGANAEAEAEFAGAAVSGPAAADVARDDAAEHLCGARRPGWHTAPPTGRYALPCARRPHGDDGEHRNKLGETWPPYCEDCGVASGPLEGLTVSEPDGTVRDGHLCPDCSERAAGGDVADGGERA